MRKIIAIIVLSCVVISANAQQTVENPILKTLNLFKTSYEGVNDSIPYKIYALQSKDFWWIWVVSNNKVNQLVVYSEKTKTYHGFETSYFLKEGTTQIFDREWVKFKDESVTLDGIKLFGYYKATRKGNRAIKNLMKMHWPNVGKRKFDIQRMQEEVKNSNDYMEQQMNKTDDSIDKVNNVINEVEGTKAKVEESVDLIKKIVD